MKQGTSPKRRAALVFALVSWTVLVFFRVELMHLSGRSAFFVAGGLFLATLLVSGLLCAYYLGFIITGLIAGPRREIAQGAAVLLAVLAGPALTVSFPTLPLHSFLWRHEAGFLDTIHSRSRRYGAKHYTHGTAFRFSWHTISDVSLFIIYEPDRPAGEQILGRDTDIYHPARYAEVHLRGPWYALLF